MKNECPCEQPGWCETYGITLTGRLFDICRGYTDAGTPVLTAAKREAYRQSWLDPSYKPPKEPQRHSTDCVYRGEPTGETHACELCGKRDKKVAVYGCAVHGKCVIEKWTNSRKSIEAAGETHCLICKECTLPDGAKPMEEFLAPSPRDQ